MSITKKMVVIATTNKQTSDRITGMIQHQNLNLISVTPVDKLSSLLFLLKSELKKATLLIVSSDAFVFYDIKITEAVERIKRACPFLSIIVYHGGLEISRPKPKGVSAVIDSKYTNLKEEVFTVLGISDIRIPVDKEDNYVLEEPTEELVGARGLKLSANNIATHNVRIRGYEITLTQNQFIVLKLLAKAKGEFIPSKILAEKAGLKDYSILKLILSMKKTMRRKARDIDRCIESKKGTGFRFSP